MLRWKRIQRLKFIVGRKTQSKQNRLNKKNTSKPKSTLFSCIFKLFHFNEKHIETDENNPKCVCIKNYVQFKTHERTTTKLQNVVFWTTETTGMIQNARESSIESLFYFIPYHWFSCYNTSHTDTRSILFVHSVLIDGALTFSIEQCNIKYMWLMPLGQIPNT